MKKLNLSSERLHFIMYEEVPLHTPMKPARGYKPKVESNLTDTNYRKEERNLRQSYPLAAGSAVTASGSPIYFRFHQRNCR